MENDEVKLKFIQDALVQYGEDVQSEMRRQIKKMGVQDTNKLHNSIRYSVNRSQYSQGELKLIFTEYGRMVDMGAGKGVKSNREKRMIFVKSRNNEARKARKIYSPIAYGLISKLSGTLQYGYTQDVIKSIKSKLK